MYFLCKQIEMLKAAILNGDIKKDDPILLEQKEGIIELLFLMCQVQGTNKTKSQIGAEIDKIFADDLGID